MSPSEGWGRSPARLADAARAAGAQLRVGERVTAIDPDQGSVGVRTEGGAVLPRPPRPGWGCARGARRPAGRRRSDPAPEGSQLKLNLLLDRLPRLRDSHVEAQAAFAGTFHVNESQTQLQEAYRQAAAGEIPALPPCEAYCHSLTDASILGPELRRSGAHTLTVFGLHMPARLFAQDPLGAKDKAVAATLRSINSVLAEPIEDCLLTTPEGEPCLEARTPVELEAELGMPGGHIFHRDLAWPFAQSDEEVGRWGVETDWPRVWLCGAGARRGGGVSGIPGHNAARAVLAAQDRRPTHPRLRADAPAGPPR